MFTSIAEEPDAVPCHCDCAATEVFDNPSFFKPLLKRPNIVREFALTQLLFCVGTKEDLDRVF